MSALVNATVKFPSREVNTRFGKRINLVLVTDSGEEIKQWGEPNDQALTSLAKNQKVVLLKDNDKYKIVNGNAPSHQPAANAQSPKNELDSNLCNKARKYIEFYDFCLKEVQKEITVLQDEDSIRTVATSIFIQTVRGELC